MDVGWRSDTASAAGAAGPEQLPPEHLHLGHRQAELHWSDHNAHNSDGCRMYPLVI